MNPHSAANVIKESMAKYRTTTMAKYRTTKLDPDLLASPPLPARPPWKMPTEVRKIIAASVTYAAVWLAIGLIAGSAKDDYYYGMFWAAKVGGILLLIILSILLLILLWAWSDGVFDDE